MEYIIINNVRERTAPSTKSYSNKVHAAGNTIRFSDVIETQSGKWGVVEGKERAFVAVEVNEKIYCVPVTGNGDITQAWILAVDAFLRSKGFSGPKPNG